MLERERLSCHMPFFLLPFDWRGRGLVCGSQDMLVCMSFGPISNSFAVVLSSIMS